MNLLKPFRKKMRELGVQPKTPVLIAVSGGMDSMVLLHMAVNGGFNVVVAHVNFKLRGIESDKDQDFVRQRCADLKIQFHTANLEVNKKEENVQIAARDLRYQWFQSLCKRSGYEAILTAHHRDDRIETFFINLLRGGGVKGLKSIPEKNGNILRPILQFSKDELQNYARDNGITWREDASNQEKDYLRNKIRHGIAVEFSKLSESANSNLMKSMDFLAEANQYFEDTASDFIHSLRIENEVYYIPEEKWNFLFAARPLHKYVLEYFGFRPEQYDALGTFGESQSGKWMESEKYKIFRDRNQFILEPKQEEKLFEIPISTLEGESQFPVHLSWRTEEGAKAFIERKSTVAYLNFEKLVFPLILRKWRNGDKFIPLGMRGSKKISDFLTDLKLGIPQKNQTFVLESAGEICWVVGLRIDDRYKYSDNQKSTFIIELHNGRA